MSQERNSHFRNIAIIAHIDHGKTTLLDALLKASHLFRENEVVAERAMDSNPQERERGITIFSKHTGVTYGDHTINIIDTPGHSDFSAEVERVLGMVDGVLLLVDAREGPMPQTRFVLSKALKAGLKPIVVINKIDRPHSDPDRVINETFDLFVELGATNEQLDFSYCFASALNGYASNDPSPGKDMTPMFELILKAVPAPLVQANEPFSMQVMTVHYNEFRGRQGTGKIRSGKVKKGDRVACIDQAGVTTIHNITHVEGYRGLTKVPLEEGVAGDIVSISGIPEVMIGDSISDASNPITFPPVHIDEPTLSITISLNSSPMVGQDGKHVTYNKIKERLFKEKRANITLGIEEDTEQQDAMRIIGRGELHLAVTIETLRREGFELSLGSPRVVIKMIDGEKCEPIERCFIEVPEEYSGAVISALSQRKGEMQHLETNEHSICAIEFLIPTRGLMGYRNEFMTVTKGLGTMSVLFEGFQPWKGEIAKRNKGVLISMAAGKATAYSIESLQERGILFVAPGDEVYEGMIVGENNRDNDLGVNVVKAKQMTNVRAAGKDETVPLTPPRRFTLERAIDYIGPDELVEVTPNNIRLRKRWLSETDRKQNSR